MPRQRTSLVPRAWVVGLLAIGLGACSNPSNDAGRPPCPRSTPVSDLSLMPRDLPLQRYATVTQIGTSKGFLGVASTSEESIVELFPRLSRALIDGGYEIRAADNEGFEAEIYFTRGHTLGSFRMREGPCEGQVTVRLLYRDKRYENAS